MSGWNMTGISKATTKDADTLSVSQAVDLAAGALDALPQLTVIGEVTGFRGPNARSGHCYFQIKDDTAAVDCIIWRGSYAKRTFEFRDGMEVQFTGSFNLYKATGRMSFVAKSFSLAGEGLLRQQVAQLAEKLRREGLMDESRRKFIPVLCTRVAVVTSLSGAVIDDVKRTLRRRNPLVELICVGAKVQGEGAEAELISALNRAAAITPAPDCILLVRGGGSFEDLMTFNNEALARAVAACSVPVITGIGHEPDTSICDMVSDRRCSTPTAAAESVAPAMSDLVDVTNVRARRLARAMDTRVKQADASGQALADRMTRAMDTRLERLRMVVNSYAARPCLTDPTNIVDRRRVQLAQTSDRLIAAIERSQQRFRAQFESMPALLAASTSGFAPKRHALELESSRLKHVGSTLLADKQTQLRSSAASLEALSPLKVLARGYSIAYGPEGVVTGIEQLNAGDNLRLALADGNVYATVDSVSESNNLSVHE